jgi:AraC-like DNA-binding protein
LFLVPLWLCAVIRSVDLIHKPTGLLASYIERLWYCDGPELVDGTLVCNERLDELAHRKQRVLPNGRFQLFFSLADAPIGGNGVTNWEVGRGALSLVVGIETHCIVIDTGRLQSAMGVLFCPGGARAFFDAPADVFCNQRVPLDLIWGSRTDEVRNRLREANTATEKFRLLEKALLERLNERIELHAAVRYALGEFARVPHIRRVLEVSRETGLSRRRFAQLFREQVGLTPKLYCRLRRFQGVLRQIAVGSPVDWADLALAGGYCDQAHLVHEFRNFSGITPNAYLANQLVNPAPVD